MIAIAKVSTIVRNLAKLEKGAISEHKTLYNLFKTITDGAGKPSPMIFEGKYLDELPESFKALTQGLKKPKVIVGTKSSYKGQGIIGIAVKDGNKTTSKLALGLDVTRGELPIIQVRGSYGDAGNKALGFNTIYDPNIPLDAKSWNVMTTRLNGGKNLSSKYLDESMRPALQIDSFLDKELAKQLGIPKDVIKDVLAHQNLKAKDINARSGVLKQLLNPKYQRIYSINDCMDDIIKIAQWKGKPTEESVRKAKDILTKRMGFDSSKISLKLEETGGGMAFRYLTGEISISPRFLAEAAHQDIAVVLSHELTHMEDHLKLYKKIGPEKFEKLVHPSITPLNHKWYQELSKHVDADKWKFDTGIMKTVVRDHEGKVITRINHQAFNANSMIKELRDDIKFAKQNYTGKFAEIKKHERYQFSALEEHARLVEKNISRELETKGLLQATKYSETYGERPIQSLGRYESRFKPIEDALEKLGGNKSKKFNEMYYQELAHENKRLADLCQRMDNGGLPAEEFEEMNQLIKTTFGDIETMYSRLILNIGLKLGGTV